MRILIVAILLLSQNVFADFSLENDPITCMAYNIYHEARNQPTLGQYAVGLVTLNRKASKKYPNRVCDVVRQSKMVESKYQKGVFVRVNCHFSWYCDDIPNKIKNQRAYSKAYRIAKDLITNGMKDFTDGCLFYHSTKVKPWWSKHYVKHMQIDKHIFYRVKT